MKLDSAGLIHAQLILTACWACCSRAVVCCRPMSSLPLATDMDRGWHHSHWRRILVRTSYPVQLACVGIRYRNPEPPLQPNAELLQLHKAKRPQPIRAPQKTSEKIGENHNTQISRLFLPILIHSLQFDSALKMGELPIVRLPRRGCCKPHRNRGPVSKRWNS